MLLAQSHKLRTTALEEEKNIIKLSSKMIPHPAKRQTCKDAMATKASLRPALEPCVCGLASVKDFAPLWC